MKRAAALAALALLAGCSSVGHVYNLPSDKAQRILAETDPPPVFGSTPLTYDVETAPGSVTWTISKGGEEVMHYRAALTPVGGGATWVTVTLTGATRGRFKDSERNLSRNASIRHLYTVAIEERIAAALEHRPFDATRIYPAIAAAALANSGSIVEQARRAGELDRQRARDNIARAYADEAAGKAY